MKTITLYIFIAFKINFILLIDFFELKTQIIFCIDRNISISITFIYYLLNNNSICVLMKI
jgi:hypothetical protein